MEEVAEETVKEDQSLLKPQETGFYAKAGVDAVAVDNYSSVESSSSGEEDTERKQSDSEDRIMPVAELSDKGSKVEDKVGEPAQDQVSQFSYDTVD